MWSRYIVPPENGDASPLPRHHVHHLPEPEPEQEPLGGSDSDSKVLFEATENGELEIVKRCLSARGLSFHDEEPCAPPPPTKNSGPDPRETLYFYRLLWAACIRDQASILEFLLNLMNHQLQCAASQPSAAATTHNCNTASVQQTVNRVDKKRGMAMIHFASNLGLLNVVRVLIDSGKADVNILDETGVTALSYACHNGYQDLVELLLGAGANPNSVGGESFEQTTPLMNAAIQGQTVIVRALLEAGADINMLDNDQRTALHWAATEGHEETVAVLLRKGADKDAVDSHGQTPLHLACQSGRHRVAALLLKADASVTLADANGCTPLHLACSEGHKRIIALLLRNWPDPEEIAPQKMLRDVLGKTPLHYLCAQPMSKLVFDALQKWGIDIVDINQQDIQGNTALICACKAGALPVIHALLINGADASLVNSDGHTAVDFARRLSNFASTDDFDMGNDIVNEVARAAELAHEPSVETDTDTVFLT